MLPDVAGDQLRVFLSSSAGELAEERQAVRAALADQEAGIASEVAEADAFIGIYGTKLDPQTKGEFYTARGHDKPVLAYVKQVDAADRDPDLFMFLRDLPAPGQPQPDSDDEQLWVREFGSLESLSGTVQRDFRYRIAQPRSHGYTISEAPLDPYGEPYRLVNPNDHRFVLRARLGLSGPPEVATTWDEVVELLDETQRPAMRRSQWVYRGQPDAEWGLSTTLERAARKVGITGKRLPRIERALLRRFRGQAKDLADSTGNWDERWSDIEWLALMQHHGAPTRLLDWSHSKYVALLFALEQAEMGKHCAVWAVDVGGLREAAIEASGDEARSWRDRDPDAHWTKIVDRILFDRDPSPLVIPFSPSAVTSEGTLDSRNERLARQSGLFLAPVDITRGFEDNLTRWTRAESEPRLEKVDILCTPQLLRDATRELHRMNVTRAALFPGLDGFSAHLGSLLSDPVLLAMDVAGDMPAPVDLEGALEREYIPFDEEAPEVETESTDLDASQIAMAVSADLAGLPAEFRELLRTSDPDHDVGEPELPPSAW